MRTVEQAIREGEARNLIAARGMGMIEAWVDLGVLPRGCHDRAKALLAEWDSNLWPCDLADKPKTREASSENF